MHSDRLETLDEDASRERIEGAEAACEHVRETWRAFEEFNIAPQLALDSLFVRLHGELGGVAGAASARCGSRRRPTTRCARRSSSRRAATGHVKAEALARAQSIPLRFLEQILLDLKHAGLVASQRGAEGGYWLAKPPGEISLADVIRAVEGPLANVRGVRPEELEYEGAATALRDVFVALRANIRAVLEDVTLADVAADELPDRVRELVARPRAPGRRTSRA